MSVQTVRRLRERNQVQFEDLCRLRDLVDELRQRRQEAYRIAETLTLDLPQRHKLLQLLERL